MIPTVVIHISGGVAYLNDKPSGVIVEIVDFDGENPLGDYQTYPATLTVVDGKDEVDA